MAEGTILVTGGAGYIGSHVVRQLGEAGERIVILDNLSTGYKSAVTHGELIVGDTGDRELVDRIIKDHDVDTVLHFAAHSIVAESVTNPLRYYENNSCGTRNLLECCAKAGWEVHAYCLMPNHFHLVVETPQPTLVAGMKWLMGVFSQGWNRRRRRRGHVFQGRYKAVVINGEETLDGKRKQVDLPLSSLGTFLGIAIGIADQQIAAAIFIGVTGCGQKTAQRGGKAAQGFGGVAAAVDDHGVGAADRRASNDLPHQGPRGREPVGARLWPEQHRLWQQHVDLSAWRRQQRRRKRGL